MGESVETSRPYGGSAYVSFGKDCTNIINTLIECGVIDDVSEIHFFKFRRENIIGMKPAGLLQLPLLICKIKMAFSDAIHFFVGGKK